MPKRFGVYPIMFFMHDEQVVVSKKPLLTTDDLAGQKIRTFYPMLDDILVAHGASAVNIPYTQQYSAMQTGLVDGSTTGTLSHLALSHYEVADYLLYGIGLGGFAPTIVVVSAERWNELPSDIQQILVDTGKKYAALAPDVVDAALEEAFATLRAEGMTVTKATSADVAKARAIAEQEVWPKWLIERGSKMGSNLKTLFLASEQTPLRRLSMPKIIIVWPILTTPSPKQESLGDGVVKVQGQ